MTSQLNICWYYQGGKGGKHSETASDCLRLPASPHHQTRIGTFTFYISCVWLPFPPHQQPTTFLQILWLAAFFACYLFVFIRTCLGHLNTPIISVLVTSLSSQIVDTIASSRWHQAGSSRIYLCKSSLTLRQVAYIMLIHCVRLNYLVIWDHCYIR